MADDKPETQDAPLADAPVAHAQAPETPAPGAPPAAPVAPVAATGSAEKKATLADLTPAATAPAELPEPKKDKYGRAYSTGKRKDAVARIWLKPGSGKITVNDRDIEKYFARPVLRMIIRQPFEVTDRVDQFDIVGTVSGGGLSGQAGAVRHGICRAMVNFEPALRPLLKKGGFLTRDSRVVERKKYGRHKARRSHQFSKR